MDREVERAVPGHGVGVLHFFHNQGRPCARARRPDTFNTRRPVRASPLPDKPPMPADTRPPAIALMGPTASGKTALALDWAQRHGGEIVSVDSALVYRGLDIGAAKPDAAERACAPHHMLDVRDPHEVFSARSEEHTSELQS